MRLHPVGSARRKRGVLSLPLLAFGLMIVPAHILPALADMQSSVATRAEDPVTVGGDEMEAFAGQAISDLALFRYSTASASFVPIPYQIDQRVEHVFNPGQPYQFTELMYDVLGEDDGLLDDDDELVFLFGDAGPQAPAAASWPAGTALDRYEIHAVDPRSGAPQPDKWVYLFAGDGLAHSGDHYVNWSLTPITAIDTAQFGLGFQDRWILDRYWVDPPCGSGEDLIDRVKGRGGLQIDRSETEELWNSASFFLGGTVGPIRAIRYVRGALSGYNTIHSDVVYRGLWERHVNLRVHGISDLWLFVDMRPSANETFFAPSVPNGVAVNGSNDPSVGTTLPPWTLVRGPGGGLAVLYDMPPSPFVLDRLLYYRDDASFDDAAYWPAYTDEDNSSFGSHGLHLDGIVGGDTDTIPLHWRIYPLCSNEGDATLGAGLRELYDVPVTTELELQGRGLEPVRGLLLQRDASDLLLAWLPAAGAITYRVYAADLASEPHEDWELLGEVSTTSYRDAGIAAVPGERLYSVVAVTASGEGPWD